MRASSFGNLGWRGGVWSRRICVAIAVWIAGCEADEEATSDATVGDAAGDADAPGGDGQVSDATETAVAIDTPVGEITPPAPTVSAVTPGIVDPQGGSHLRIEGEGLGQVTSVLVGGVLATSLRPTDDGALMATTGAVPAGTGLAVTLRSAVGDATWSGTLEAWSPAQIAGARVFDAASGIQGSEVGSAYEWERLSPVIHPDWRWRDGAALNWLPATGKFWMTGGWNGQPVPEGFGEPQITTNEVWSTRDGVDWTLELADHNDQFERRHVHNALLWHDRLWLIGGDGWQSRYNNDIVSSADGVHWRVEVETVPWAYEPDGTLHGTSGRALQVAGVFQDKLWVVGGQDGIISLVEYPDDPSYVPHTQFHNDVWNSDDGVHWVKVAADTAEDPPTDPTRWSGRGLIDRMVEFKGRLWLVGGARYTAPMPNYEGTFPTSYFAEVWSTVDGVSWKKHATPPWPGRAWNSVLVFDGRLWTFAGGNDSGNSNESWFTDDGEHWTQVAPGLDSYSQSHADGFAVGADPTILLRAGGNYSYGNAYAWGHDRSSWRMRAFHGVVVDGWTDRAAGLTVTASGTTRPLVDPNALGEGMAGVQFDGIGTHLDLAAADLQPSGRSVFWVGRTPWNRQAVVEPGDVAPYETYPSDTVVGDGGVVATGVGLTEGQLQYSDDASPSQPVRAGSGLMREEGDVRFAGFTHASDGALQAYVDGVAEGDAAARPYVPDSARWSTIGAGWLHAPKSHYGGTLGAVIIVPTAIDAATVARMHAWAQGRFGAP